MNISDFLLGYSAGQSGGTPTPPAPVVETQRGVNFIDYDGTLIAVWQFEEVAGKTALPPKPSHDGLIADGWNWTLAEIKEALSTYPSRIDVGQLYKTASGLTEVDCEFTKATGLSINLNMTGEKDWGDGTTDDLTSHTYDEYGKYTIKCGGTVTGTNGMFNSRYSPYENNTVTDIRVGDSIDTLYQYLFSNCQVLRTVTFHSGIDKVETNSYLFNGCHSVISATMPTVVYDTQHKADYTFRNCRALKKIALPMNCIKYVGSFFLDGAYCLSHYRAAPGITNISNYAFQYADNCPMFDFSACTSVPTLGSGAVFGSISKLAKIVVPDALYDSWISAWSAYADYIYKASEVLV